MGVAVMRVMVIVKGDRNSEAGVLPSEELLAAMGRFNEELAKAGLLLAGEGLQPTSKGARVRFSGDKRVVIDGPFAETKELIAGFWLWEVDSLAEAIEWVKRCPNPTGEESEIEIRPLYEAADFAPVDPTGEHRAAEERLRAQLAAKLGETTFTTPADDELLVTRVLAAPRERVFDAWTSPRHLPNWMLGPPGWSMPVCEIDLRPGGGCRFVWRGGNGEMEIRGTYREVARPERIEMATSWGGDWPETHETLTLTEKDGRTTLAQSIRYPSMAARDAALATGMKEGMDQSYRRLDEYLRTLV